MPTELPAGAKSQLDDTVHIERDPAQPREYLGPQPDASPEGDDSLDNLHNVRKSAPVKLGEFRKGEKEINASPLLSAAGKLDARRKLADAIEKGLAPCDAVVAHHVEQLAILEKELTGVALFKDVDSPAAIRSMEVRAWLGGLEHAKRIEVIHNAFATGDDEVLGAVINAPRAFGLIPDEIRKHLVEALVEKRAPEKVAALARHRRAVEIAQFSLQRVRELMRGDTPAPMRERAVFEQKK